MFPQSVLGPVVISGGVVVREVYGSGSIHTGLVFSLLLNVNDVTRITRFVPQVRSTAANRRFVPYFPTISAEALVIRL